MPVCAIEDEWKFIIGNQWLLRVSVLSFRFIFILLQHVESETFVDESVMQRAP